MTRVYVGNLATSVTSHDLRTHFEQAGEVLGAMAVRDRVSGLCRGIGVVEMAEVTGVKLAFSLLNHSELNGKRITIEPQSPSANGHLRARRPQERRRPRIADV